MSHYIRDTHAQVMGNQLVDDDEVAEQVFLGAKDNHPAISMSCSHAHINTRAASGPTPVCALRDGAGHSQSLGHVLSVVEKRLKKHERLYSRAA